MPVVKLLNKLQPLLPEQVRYWREVLPQVNEKTKSLLEREIHFQARQVLGRYEDKLLTSLPSEKRAKGTIHLGSILYEKEKWHCGIREDELIQNLGIYGRSGSGKTNIAFHLIQQLETKKIPFLFLDWKRTARHLLPTLKKKVNVFTPGRELSPFPFNPFIPPPGLEPSVYNNHLVDVLSDAYTLGDGSRSLIRKVLFSTSKDEWPTPQQVLLALERMPTTGRSTGWKTTAIRALESLVLFNPFESQVTQKELVRSLLEESTIIELDSLDQSMKKFLIPLLGLWIYYVRLAGSDREKLKLVIFIEEAHHVLYKQQYKAKESVMNMLLRQCRELGIAIVVIDQHPSLLSQVALGNTYTSICLNQKDQPDINRASSLSLLDQDDKTWLSRLPIGQGVVKLQDRWNKPFLVRFPLVEFKKGLVDGSMLKNYVEGKTPRYKLRRKLDEQLRKEGISESQEVISDDAVEFLKDVFNYPNDPVRRRYKRLGWGVNKSTALKSRLLKSGLIEQEYIRIARTKKLLLRITSSGKKALGLHVNETRRESLAHEFWKNYYLRALQDNGYNAVKELPLRKGRVDVFGEKRYQVLSRYPPPIEELVSALRGDRIARSTERLAFEIETGKSDVVFNVIKNLEENFTRIVVIATCKEALDKVKRQLERAGLHGHPRVRIIRSDKLEEDLFVSKNEEYEGVVVSDVLVRSDKELSFQIGQRKFAGRETPSGLPTRVP